MKVVLGRGLAGVIGPYSHRKMGVTLKDELADHIVFVGLPYSDRKVGVILKDVY